MDYPNLYLVSFDTKHGRQQQTTTYVINVSAYTIDEAKSKAKSLWEENHDKHMFHLYARCLKEGEEFLWSYFKENPLATDARDNSATTPANYPDRKILAYIEEQKAEGNSRNLIIAQLRTFGVDFNKASSLYDQTERKMHEVAHHRR